MSEEVKATDGQMGSNPEPAVSESLLGQATETVANSEPENVNPLTNEIPATAQDTANVDTVNNTETEVDNLEYTDFVIPEGISIDNELLESFKPIAKELKLNQEQAQKLVDLQANAIKKANDSFQLQFQETVKDLQNQTKQRLGANWQKELSYAAKAMTLLPKEQEKALREVLSTSGLGEHPDVVSFFVEVGKKLSEDNFVEGKSQQPERSTASILFGDMKMK